MPHPGQGEGAHGSMLLNGRGITRQHTRHAEHGRKTGKVGSVLKRAVGSGSSPGSSGPAGTCAMVGKARPESWSRTPHGNPDSSFAKQHVFRRGSDNQAHELWIRRTATKPFVCLPERHVPKSAGRSVTQSPRRRSARPPRLDEIACRRLQPLLQRRRLVLTVKRPLMVLARRPNRT